jgi:hypothetical protein
MKESELAKLINDLRDVAVEFADTQQLRERIKGVLLTAMPQLLRPERVFPARLVVGYAVLNKSGFVVHVGKYNYEDYTQRRAFAERARQAVIDCHEMRTWNWRDFPDKYEIELILDKPEESQ